MTGDWSLTTGQLPGVLGVLVLVAAIGLAVVEGVRTFRHRGMARRPTAVALCVLRLVALGLLLAMVFELTLRIEERGESRRRLVVLLDESRSMALADARDDEDPRSRWARVQTAWAEADAARVAWNEAGLDIDVHGFGRTTRALSDLESALESPPEQPASALSRALERVAETTADGRGAPVAGVVVISDGLVARDSAEDRHLMDLAQASATTGIPITTVFAGAAQISDIALTNLRVGEFAFVENVTEFEVDLVAHGFEGRPVTVRLLRDGREVAQQATRLVADGQPLPVRFEIAPDRTGQFVYEFAVEPIDEEASVDNNRRAFVVKVLRDKVRVLHVAGRPDWDVRSLRTLLKRDPNVELLSYYILRDGDDVARDDDTAPMSLIAFPTAEIFGSELGSFDLVIMHNFDASRHGDYLPNIVDYVLEGGSLVIIGGDMGLAAGEYALPSFNRLLGVDASLPTGIETAGFRPQVTAAGRRHPITAWLVAGGRSGWEGLPELDSFNRGDTSPHASDISAATLLEHPRGTPRAPLLAVAEPGKGRTMVLATGASWRIGFAPDLPLVDGARPYDLLWLGAVRWLLRDESTERLVLETDKPTYDDHEAVELRLRTFSASYAPEGGIEVDWQVRALGDERAVRSGRWTSDELGKARDLLEGLAPGAYEARAWPSEESAPDVDEVGDVARRVFLVGLDGLELDSVDADPGGERLERLADASNGTFVDLAAGDSIPTSPPLGDRVAAKRELQGRRDIPLWDGWAVLVLLLLAYPGEWWLRRRNGHA